MTKEPAQKMNNHANKEPSGRRILKEDAQRVDLDFVYHKEGGAIGYWNGSFMKILRVGQACNALRSLEQGYFGGELYRLSIGDLDRIRSTDEVQE